MSKRRADRPQEAEETLPPLVGAFVNAGVLQYAGEHPPDLKAENAAYRFLMPRGIDLPEEAGIYECAESSRYSTLQDIDAGRRTEVDSLCGYLIKMARENGIEVPYIEYTYHAIKAIEEKNEGLFES